MDLLVEFYHIIHILSRKYQTWSEIIDLHKNQMPLFCLYNFEYSCNISDIFDHRADLFLQFWAKNMLNFFTSILPFHWYRFVNPKIRFFKYFSTRKGIDSLLDAICFDHAILHCIVNPVFFFYTIQRHSNSPTKCASWSQIGLTHSIQCVWMYRFEKKRSHSSPSSSKRSLEHHLISYEVLHMPEDRRIRRSFIPLIIMHRKGSSHIWCILMKVRERICLIFIWPDRSDIKRLIRQWSLVYRVSFLTQNRDKSKEGVIKIVSHTHKCYWACTRENLYKLWCIRMLVVDRFVRCIDKCIFSGHKWHLPRKFFIWEMLRFVKQFEKRENFDEDRIKNLMFRSIPITSNSTDMIFFYERLYTRTSHEFFEYIW